MSSTPPIVAVGASAGGLEALEVFFGAIPERSGLAFVVVQHLSPDFKSVMDDLLARRTKLPIEQAAEGTEILSDTIYLNPPKTELTIEGGCFRLMAPADARKLSLPIDVFLTSLAQQLKARAIAVILSGTGSDGTKGALAVKAAGGRVFAQSAETAKFDGMPRAAIASGAVDFVGAPLELAAAVTATQKPRGDVTAGLGAGLSPATGPLAELFDLMRKATGVDFEQYRPTTVMRRLDRRRQMMEHDDLESYLELVRGEPSERDALLRELLIEVTLFFRDPEAFDALALAMQSNLRAANEPVRVWVPGCATGEEAYSWAILLQEACAGFSSPVSIKVFATDVHRSSLDFASVGRYAPAALHNLEQPLRDKYFEFTDDHYQVRPELRSKVVFAEHNLLKDPPFTRVDAISCRNLLIYLEPSAQDEVLSRFLFALKPEGVLFLGPSESLGRLTSAFRVEDRHWRVFRKAFEGRLASGVPLPRPTARHMSVGRRPPAAAREGPARTGIPHASYDRLLARFVPAGFLVDAHGMLQHTFSDAGRYLHVAGRTSPELISMLSGDLRVAVSAGMRRAQRDSEAVSYSGVRAETTSDESLVVTVTVAPLEVSTAGVRSLFIQFEQPREAVASSTPEHLLPDELTRRHIAELEDALQEARENLRITVEELEASNEELQATNEELLASNEELQSTNEELQSVNEELFTVNAEYEKRNAELIESNRDLGNLMDSTDIGTIFLDDQLNIRKFTPAIVRAFRLKAQDVGRPLGDIASFLGEESNLLEEAQTVLSHGETSEREVATADGHHLLQRVTPYRGEHGTIDGVVVVFVDLTMEFKVRAEMARIRDLQQAVLESLPANVAVLGPNGDILGVNSAWKSFAQDNGAGEMDPVGLGSNYFAACVGALSGPNQADAQRALSGIRDVLQQRASKFEMQYPCHSPAQRRWFQMNVTPLRESEGAGEVRGAVVMHLDVSEARSARSELEHLLAAVSHADIGFYITDADGTIRHANEALLRMTGYEQGELMGQSTRIFRSGAHSKGFYRRFWQSITNGQTWSGQFVNRRKDGREFVAETTVSAVGDELGGPRSFLAFARDVTETRRLDEQMRRSQKLETVGQLAGGVAHDFNNLLTPIIGYAEILLEEIEPEQGVDLVQPILEAATLAQDLTRQLLTFSRKQPMELSTFDLNDLVTDFSRMMRRLLRENIEIEYGLRAAPLPVEADRRQLEQVLLNLAVNAQDAMAQGGHLSISTDRVDIDRANPTLHPDLQPGTYGLLSLRDTGEGISAEAVDRLFEPFYTTKPAGKGTGLGLATAYGVARRHDGVILVKSAPGEGSIFTLAVPLESGTTAPASQDDAPLAPAERGAGEYIAVVEDDPRVRKLTVRVLEDGGYTVRAFERPSEALQQLTEANVKAPDLLLSDVVMPEMSGPDLLEGLRERGVQVPVVFMSGYPGEILDQEESLRSVDLIAKPFSRQALLQYVRRALDHASLSHRTALDPENL